MHDQVSNRGSHFNSQDCSVLNGQVAKRMRNPKISTLERGRWLSVRAAVLVAIGPLVVILLASYYAMADTKTEPQQSHTTPVTEASAEADGNELDAGPIMAHDAGQAEPPPDAGLPESKGALIQDEPVEEKQPPEQVHWRNDPKVPRRTGSYLGWGVGYSMLNAKFTPIEDEFKEELSLGPMHAFGLALRVGDVIREWFTVGFQIQLTGGTNSEAESITAFGILLDATFYPWRGLGIRPSVGLGVSYAVGKEDYQLGYGWPADLSLSVNYEFRVARTFTLGPVAQIYWIPGEDYNGFFFFIGIEFSKWFVAKNQPTEEQK